MRGLVAAPNAGTAPCPMTNHDTHVADSPPRGRATPRRGPRARSPRPPARRIKKNRCEVSGSSALTPAFRPASPKSPPSGVKPRSIFPPSSPRVVGRSIRQPTASYRPKQRPGRHKIYPSAPRRKSSYGRLLRAPPDQRATESSSTRQYPAPAIQPALRRLRPSMAKARPQNGAHSDGHMLDGHDGRPGAPR